MNDYSPSWVDAQLDAIDEREWTECDIDRGWLPSHVRLARRIRAVTYERDEKNSASSAESQEASY